MTSLEQHLIRQAERSRKFFWHRVRWKAVRLHLPPRPITLLDVGAGGGLLGEYLLTHDPSATYAFVEPITALQQQLERRFGSAANAQKATILPNVVALLDVLEHQEDDEQFLKKLADEIPVGAKLILTVPATEVLWSGWDTALGHCRRYDKRTLRQLTKSLPLELLEVSYLFPELVPLAFLRKWRTKNAPSNVEFPQLPAPLNGLLLFIGTITLHLRRIMPFGSSLLAVFERKDL